MHARDRLGKIFLGLAVALLILLAGLGLIFFERIVPRSHTVTFSFEGWTNDTQGAPLAVLAISNRSHEAVVYFADRGRRPRCEVTAIISRQRIGKNEHIAYSNIASRVWDGSMPLQLRPQTRIDCVLPWRDQYTNARITFFYLPEADVVQRVHEKLGALVGHDVGRSWRRTPLTGAPWTNAIDRDLSVLGF